MSILTCLRVNPVRDGRTPKKDPIERARGHRTVVSDEPEDERDRRLAGIEHPCELQLADRGGPLSESLLRDGELEMSVPIVRIAVKRAAKGKFHRPRLPEPARNRAGDQIGTVAERVQLARAVQLPIRGRGIAPPSL